VETAQDKGRGRAGDGAPPFADRDMTATFQTENRAAPLPAEWRDFFALTKPRVMSLVVFTGLCGLLAAPGPIHPVIGFAAVLCIALGAGGAGALNMWWEADLDARMRRTAGRPLPQGRLSATDARDFGIALAAASVGTMGVAVNWLAAAILALSIVYYAVVYTIWLKPRTPQNIVIGGGAGAFPPLIGWVAVTNEITLMPVLLFAIIFLWTPPHFWALALFVKSDYAKAGIPMLPVVAGEAATRKQILAYATILLPVSIAPYWIGGTGEIYLIAAAALSVVFVVLCIPVYRHAPEAGDRMKPEKRLFGYSVFYLFALFAALVADRLVLA
jgi:protoheme IX farnesyltransferase